MFQDLNPMDKPTAIMEIAIMLAIAALLGFIIGYFISKLHKDKLKSELRFSDDKYAQLNKRYTALEREHREFESLVSDLRNRKSSLVQELEEVKSQDNSGLTKENEEQKIIIAQLKSGLEAEKTKNETLVAEIAAMKEAEIKEKSTPVKSESKSLSMEAFKIKKLALSESIGDLYQNEKDNLTAINGIGPLIEAKLNTIGIYNYKQIAALTSKDIVHVTDLIEFFPGRIERDKWIQQAKEMI